MLLTAAIICLTGVIYMNELQASTVDTNNYVASSFVTTGHQIPPQQQFSVSITYATGLLYFPIAIISLSLLSVLIFQIIFWVRGCFHFICPKTCECYYNNESASVSDPAQRKAMHSRAIYWFFTFLLFTFITNFFVFVGDTSLRSSGSEASESIVQSANLFSDINNYAHSISFEFGNISKSFSTSPCQEFWIQAKTYSDVINECKQGQSSATQLSSIISSIPNTLNSANDVLTDQGLYYKNIAVYVLFAVILLSTVLLFAAYFIQRKWLLTVAVELSLLMVLLTTLVGATLMFVVVRNILANIIYIF